jgi:hypothetical protein
LIFIFIIIIIIILRIKNWIKEKRNYIFNYGNPLPFSLRQCVLHCKIYLFPRELKWRSRIIKYMNLPSYYTISFSFDNQY